MMDERRQEQAGLYMLGALPPEERAEFERALGADAELRKLVSQLSDVAGAMARAVPRREPPPQLKAKILSRIASKTNAGVIPPPAPVAAPQPAATDAGAAKVMAFPQWMPWALAASLAVSTAWLGLERASLRGESGRLRDQVARLSARVAEMDGQLAGLNGQMNTLQAELVVYRGASPFDAARVAVLDATGDPASKARAVSVWDAQKQTGVLVVENLKALPADKDYQLWVIDPTQAAPVSAGVFSVDAEGKGRVVFKPAAAIATAGKFAVTVEQKGGVPSPTLSAMVLIGG
jgi:anti-sigma-K factor RskA